MVCRNVQVALPSSAVSGGHDDRSFANVVTAAAAPAPAAPRAAGFEEVEDGAVEDDDEADEDEEEDAGAGFFLIFILPQSCQELHTLHTLPSLSKIRPGGRFGCVSFVVLSGSGMLV